MKQFLDIALIITSVALILSVILQSKGAGLGGLTGSDTGGVYTARRGIERTLFWVSCWQLRPYWLNRVFSPFERPLPVMALRAVTG